MQSPALRRLSANDSYVFLMKELEKVDDKILEPLTGTDWPRYMPVITGGGITESIATIDVSYASTGRDDDNIFFDAANDIPVIQGIRRDQQHAKLIDFLFLFRFKIRDFFFLER